MKLKLFELRDKATFIPVFAFRTYSDHALAYQEKWLLRRAGFNPTDNNIVVVGRLECSGVDRNCTYDPYAWGGRTYPVAHHYIAEHFEELQSGQVIDVEFILSESESPKLSEAVDPFDELHHQSGGATVSPEQTEQVARTARNQPPDSTAPTLSSENPKENV